MAIREILKEGNATLRKNARQVTDFDERLWMLLDDMADTLVKADGVGLAAPQVGILRRIFIIDEGEGVVEYINAEILSQSGSQTGFEGCLSLPGKHAIVTRPNFVKVKALDRHGCSFEKTLEGLGARAFFHEDDHLKGVLFTDNADRKFNDEEFEEYIEELSKKEEEMNISE